MSGSIENLGWLQKYTGLEPKELEKFKNPSEIDESVFTKIGIEVKDEIDQGETSQLALHASGFDIGQEKIQLDPEKQELFVEVESWGDGKDASKNNCLTRIVENSYDVETLVAKTGLDEAKVRQMIQDAMVDRNDIRNPNLILDGAKIYLPDLATIFGEEVANSYTESILQETGVLPEETPEKTPEDEVDFKTAYSELPSNVEKKLNLDAEDFDNGNATYDPETGVMTVKDFDHEGKEIGTKTMTPSEDGYTVAYADTDGKVTQTLVYDKDGKIQKQYEGATPEETKEFIENLPENVANTLDIKPEDLENGNVTFDGTTLTKKDFDKDGKEIGTTSVVPTDDGYEVVTKDKDGNITETLVYDKDGKLVNSKDEEALKETKEFIENLPENVANTLDIKPEDLENGNVTFDGTTLTKKDFDKDGKEIGTTSVVPTDDGYEVVTKDKDGNITETLVYDKDGKLVNSKDEVDFKTAYSELPSNVEKKLNLDNEDFDNGNATYDPETGVMTVKDFDHEGKEIGTKTMTPSEDGYTVAYADTDGKVTQTLVYDKDGKIQEQYEGATPEETKEFIENLPENVANTLDIKPEDLENGNVTFDGTTLTKKDFDKDGKEIGTTSVVPTDDGYEVVTKDKDGNITETLVYDKDGKLVNSKDEEALKKTKEFIENLPENVANTLDIKPEDLENGNVTFDGTTLTKKDFDKDGKEIGTTSVVPTDDGYEVVTKDKDGNITETLVYDKDGKLVNSKTTPETTEPPKEDSKKDESKTGFKNMMKFFASMVMMIKAPFAWFAYQFFKKDE